MAGEELAASLGSLLTYFQIVLIIITLWEVFRMFGHFGGGVGDTAEKMRDWFKKSKEEKKEEKEEERMIYIEEAEINKMLTDVSTLRTLLDKKKAADVAVPKVQVEAQRLVAEYNDLRKFEQTKLTVKQLSDKMKGDPNLKNLLTKDMSMFQLLTATIGKLMTDLERISGTRGSNPEAGLKDAKSDITRLNQLLLVLKQIDREEYKRIKGLESTT